MRKIKELILRRTKEFFLKIELRNNSFIIGGYKDGMVRINGKRFLNYDEVEMVHEYRKYGLLTDAGEWNIASPNGNEYSKKLYRLK
jgi:hypothetical protein